MDTPVNVSNTDINNFLVRRLGEKEAAEIMTYIDKEVTDQVYKKVDDSKNEIRLWREDMSKVFASKEDYEAMQKKLTRRVSGAENTLILWSIVLWLTAMIIIFCFFKFYK